MRIQGQDCLNRNVFSSLRCLHTFLCRFKTRNAKVNLEEPRRHPSRQRITTPQSPHSPSKLPIPLRRSSPPSNTSIPRPTPLTTPNDIQIQSAVLSQYTLRGDRPTDGLGDNSVPASGLLHARLYVVERTSNVMPLSLFLKFRPLISRRSGNCCGLLCRIGAIV